MMNAVIIHKFVVQRINKMRFLQLNILIISGSAITACVLCEEVAVITQLGVRL